MKSQQWSSVREVLQDFSKNLNKYAQYLEERNEAMKSRQSHLELRTDLNDLSILGSKSILPGPSARYNTIHEALRKIKSYKAIFVNDHAPPDPRRRYEYMQYLVVPMKCVKYVYTGSTNHMVFVWKVPIDSSETEVLNNSTNITNELKKDVSCVPFKSHAARICPLLWNSYSF